MAAATEAAEVAAAAATEVVADEMEAEVEAEVEAEAAEAKDDAVTACDVVRVSVPQDAINLEHQGKVAETEEEAVTETAAPAAAAAAAVTAADADDAITKKLRASVKRLTNKVQEVQRQCRNAATKHGHWKEEADRREGGLRAEIQLHESVITDLRAQLQREKDKVADRDDSITQLQLNLEQRRSEAQQLQGKLTKSRGHAQALVAAQAAREKEHEELLAQTVACTRAEGERTVHLLQQLEETQTARDDIAARVEALQKRFDENNEKKATYVALLEQKVQEGGGGATRLRESAVTRLAHMGLLYGDVGSARGVAVLLNGVVEDGARDEVWKRAAMLQQAHKPMMGDADVARAIATEAASAARKRAAMGADDAGAQDTLPPMEGVSVVLAHTVSAVLAFSGVNEELRPAASSRGRLMAELRAHTLAAIVSCLVQETLADGAGTSPTRALQAVRALPRLCAQLHDTASSVPSFTQKEMVETAATFACLWCAIYMPWSMLHSSGVIVRAAVVADAMFLEVLQEVMPCTAAQGRIIASLQRLALSVTTTGSMLEARSSPIASIVSRRAACLHSRIQCLRMPPDIEQPQAAAAHLIATIFMRAREHRPHCSCTQAATLATIGRMKTERDLLDKPEQLLSIVRDMCECCLLVGTIHDVDEEGHALTDRLAHAFDAPLVNVRDDGALVSDAVDAMSRNVAADDVVIALSANVVCCDAARLVLAAVESMCSRFVGRSVRATLHDMPEDMSGDMKYMSCTTDREQRLAQMRVLKDLSKDWHALRHLKMYESVPWDTPLIRLAVREVEELLLVQTGAVREYATQQLPPTRIAREAMAYIVRGGSSGSSGSSAGAAAGGRG